MSTYSEEAWRPVIGFEGFYEVSSLGRVRSLDRDVGGSFGSTRRIKGRVLRYVRHSGDYATVLLTAPGADRRHRYVHRIVAAAFFGPCPEGEEVMHLNHDRWDNRVVNLRYGSHAENCAMMVTDGRSNTGLRHWSAKVDVRMAEEIKKAHAAGEGGSIVLGRRFGVAHSTICDIVNGNHWTQRRG